MKGTTIFRLYEEGKLDLDKPVSEYVKSWPKKHPPISVRQIASHTSGIRHYKENPESNDTSDHDTKYPEFYSNVPYKEIEDALEVFKDDDLLSEPGRCNAKLSFLDILNIFYTHVFTFRFLGKEFNYTTHGFTLLSAVIESASGEKFTKHIKKLFKDLGLNNTHLDENEPIIQNRSRLVN